MAGEVLSKQRLEEIREDVYQVHEWSGIDIRHSDVRLLIETIDHYVLRAEAAERDNRRARALLTDVIAWLDSGCDLAMLETEIREFLAAKGGEDGK